MALYIIPRRVERIFLHIQLRVHAAHPSGLNAPIVGDRLYGRAAPREGERLMLHAELLSFEHPVTGARLRVESAAPF